MDNSKNKLVQFGPRWGVEGPQFVDSSPEFYLDGEQVTDPEIWGLAFAIRGFAFELHWHSNDLARELVQLLSESKHLRVTGTIEPEHQVKIEDHKMVLRIEFSTEEIENAET